MSTRLYPLYVKGNPQLRVFLPNFWMKLVKPKKKVPPNHVHFIVPLEMTKYDVKNYLEKIYNVPVESVRVEALPGEIKPVAHKGYLIKDDDYRMAYVTLPPDQKFEYPNLFPDSSKHLDKEIEQYEQTRKLHLEKQRSRWQRQDVPNWFGI